MPDLDRERQVFERHLNEWRKAHLGEFVLIKNDEVIDFYPTLDDAFNVGLSRYGVEPFFVQQITPTDGVNVSFFGARILSA